MIYRCLFVLDRGGQVGAVEHGIRSFCEDTSVQMLRPVVGMKFSSKAEAYDFYNTYSWVLGFSIRNGDNFINSKGVQTMQELICQRAVSKFVKNDHIVLCWIFKT